MRSEQIPATSFHFINPWTFACHLNFASSEKFTTFVCTGKDTFAFPKIIHGTVDLDIWIGCNWSFGGTCYAWTEFLKVVLSQAVNFLCYTYHLFWECWRKYFHKAHLITPFLMRPGFELASSLTD